jgi:hypothetical protein
MVSYRMPDAPYTLEFVVGDKPFSLEITRRTRQDNATRATRFLDVHLPASTFVRVEIATDGEVAASYDASGDGVPETTLVPGFNVSNAPAGDLQPPTIQAASAGHAITLSATDGSGISDLHYSFDGQTARSYSGPISYDPESTSFIFAFATDGVGNRTGLVKLALSPPIRIRGQVELQNYSVRAETVLIEFARPGSTTLVASRRVPLDRNGNFDFWEVLPPGPYSVFVKGDHWLKRKVVAQANATEMSPIQVSLFNGDANGDNVVDISDLSFLSISFGSALGDPNYNRSADLNGDGQVNMADYAIISANYGLEGD